MRQAEGLRGWLVELERVQRESLRGSYDEDFCRWVLVWAAGPGLPAFPAAALRAWRRLAGQLRRVLAWQERIFRGPALGTRDWRRYSEQDRQLTHLLAGLGRQRFLWARSWAETAARRGAREAPRDPAVVREELVVNADLLGGVERVLRARGTDLAERVLLGAPATYSRDFVRVLPAVLLSEHFRERRRNPGWQTVARMLSRAGRWPLASGEAVRKAVARLAAARRRELYAWYYRFYARGRRPQIMEVLSDRRRRQQGRRC